MKVGYGALTEVYVTLDLYSFYSVGQTFRTFRERSLFMGGGPVQIRGGA